MRLRAGQNGVEGGSGVGAIGKYPTGCMSCGRDVERGGWWGQKPQNTDVTAKEPVGQAKREREPLTGPGQRDAGHCWPLLRALSSGVLRKAWRPRPRELGRHLPELTQERALLVLPTQRTGARGSSADAAGHVASRATPVSVLRSCSGPPFPLTWKESSVMGSSARAGFQKDQKKKKACVFPPQGTVPGGRPGSHVGPAL